MRKSLFFLLGLFSLVTFCNAQVSSYGFTSGAGGYPQISGGTAIQFGTQVLNANRPVATLDDDNFYDRPVGFSFNYNGIAFDRFGINSNGFIFLGSGSLTSGLITTPISSSLPGLSNVVSAAGTDLLGGARVNGAITAGGNTLTSPSNFFLFDFVVGDSVTGTGIPAPGAKIIGLTSNTVTIDRTFNATVVNAPWQIRNGEIRFETVGSAPNRTLVVQFSRFSRFGGNVDERLNFQIRLYETSNKIELVYGKCYAVASVLNLQVGLKGNTNTDFNNRTSTTGWASSIGGVTNVATMPYSSGSSPSSGLTYTFTPVSTAGALNFDGVNDGVVINNSASVQLTTGTAEAWIKTSNAGSSWRGIVVKQWAYSLFLYNNELICYDWSAGNISTGIFLADNQWHHVAVSFAGGVPNGSKIYVDGALVKTFTYNIVNQSIGLAVGLGSNYSVQNFTGTIDEVRVWNRQLSQAEIQNNKNCELPAVGNGLVVYYKLNQGVENGNNAGVTTASDASGLGNNGSLINFGLIGSTSNWVTGNINGTCAVFTNSYLITSSASANGTISPLGNTNVVAGNSQTYTITPNAGYQIADVLVDGISVGAVASYTFNNVTAARSIAASFTPLPPPANALNFDGNDDKVSTASPLITGTSDFTISAWIKTTTSGSADCIAGNYCIGSIVNNGIEFYVFQNHLISYIAGSYLNGSIAIVPGNWYHVAVSRTAGVTSLYVNGVLDATASQPQSIPGGANFAIGNFPSTFTGEAFGGTIDEVRVYQRGLNANEICKLGSAEASTVSTQNMALYFNFNEGSGLVANNSAGSPLAGTLQNGVQWVYANYSLLTNCVSTAPVIDVSATSINYGHLGLGFSLKDSVIITNTGNAPLNISGIVSSNPVYSFSYAKNTLAPGDTTRLIVRYTPTIAGASPATLTINHNAAGSPTIINLNGIAVATGYTYQVNQIPGLTDNLYGASWFNNRIGFVSGANGKLYKTTDGGATWTMLPFAGTATLYSIRAIGSALWLFGANGHICVSYDGGLTFTPFSTGTTNAFYGGYFVNGYYGFAVGSNGTLCRYNGTAWEPYNVGLTNNFYGVYAYGNSAWAVGSGGIVCRYNRACNCWQPINPGVPNNIYGVGFWNEDIGYIVGRGGLIYRTVNGGTSWIPCVSGVNVDIRKIRCYNANIAWAICSDGRILQTKDGGVTWVQLPLGNFNFEDVDFNGCQGIAICQNGAVVTFQIDVCNTSFNPYYTRISTGTSYNYGSAWIGSPTVCAVGGRFGSVSFTGNGGQSWYSTNPYTTEDINCVRIIGNSSFIAGSGGYIAKCNRFGTNWVRFGGIPGNITFYSMAFYGNGTGWAVGSGGTICFYNGTSWVPYNTGGITNTFRCVYVIGEVAYAVGTNGIICKYINGGWIDVSPGVGVTNDFYGCAFVTPLIGYAVGSGGIICKTINGGQSWFPINTCPTSEDLLCVEVGCTLEAMVAGKNGTAFQTSNGGNSWDDKGLQRPVNINSISLLDGSGLLAADDGEVYAFAFGAGKVTGNIVASGATTFCEGGSVTLTASGGTSYLWSGGQTTPAINVTDAGIYTVTVSNAAGCSDEKSQSVVVNPKPVIEFTMQEAICANAPVLPLTATPTGGLFSGPGVSGNQFDPAAAGTGVKTITYTYTNAEGCSASKSADIRVHDVSTIVFTLPPAVCINGGVISLSATPAGGVYSGDGLSNSTFNPALAGTGLKTVSYTYTNASGCTSSREVGIQVNDISPITFTLQQEICANANSITLSAQPSGGVFSGPGVTGNQFDPAAAGTGVKTISYTYTNANGCTSSLSRNITVNAVPVVNAGSNAIVYLGYTPQQCTTLTGSASSGTPSYTYLWSNGSTSASTQVCPSTSTNFTLTATDSKGCKASSGVMVTVVDVRCGTVRNPKVKVCQTNPQKQTVRLCVDENAVPALLANGSYLGDCATSTKFAASAVVLTEVAKSINVTPNPSNGDFTFNVQQLQNGLPVTIKIYTMTGQLVEQITSSANRLQVGRKFLPGVYIAEISQGKFTQKLKLVKQ